VTCTGGTVEIGDLPDYVSGKGSAPKRTTKHLRQRDEVLQALRDHNHNRTRTAEALGISRVALWKRMKRLGLLSA